MDFEQTIAPAAITLVLFHIWLKVNKAFDLKLVEYNYFEAGEGTHFAHISHKIIR